MKATRRFPATQAHVLLATPFFTGCADTGAPGMEATLSAAGFLSRTAAEMNRDTAFGRYDAYGPYLGPSPVIILRR